MNWDPLTYKWPDGSNGAACLSIDVDSIAPYYWQHRNGTPATIASPEHRRFGMRRGLARISRMLERVGARATFFVPSIVAEENPELLPGLLDRGHEIALHGHLHELVGETSDEDFTEALEKSIDVFVHQTGFRPEGFRSPAWEMTPYMLSELRRLDLWDSSLMGEDVPYDVLGVTEVPVRWENDDAIFFKFLGAGDNPPRSDQDVFQQWKADADAQIDENCLFMLTIHDWISGRANRVLSLEKLIQHLQSLQNVWIATCGEIALHHRATYLNTPNRSRKNTVTQIQARTHE